MTPGSTTTNRFAMSTSRMWFIRDRLITTPPAAGSAPPLNPVPAPRLTKGILCRAQMRTTACTSPVLRGSTTAPGITRKLVSPSHSSVCNWLSPVINPSAPTAARSSSMWLWGSTLPNSILDPGQSWLHKSDCQTIDKLNPSKNGGNLGCGLNMYPRNRIARRRIFVARAAPIPSKRALHFLSAGPTLQDNLLILRPGSSLGIARGQMVEPSAPKSFLIANLRQFKVKDLYEFVPALIIRPKGKNLLPCASPLSLPVRTTAGVTPITADPSCEEQNSAGFEEVFAGSGIRALEAKRTRPWPLQVVEKRRRSGEDARTSTDRNRHDAPP